MLRHGYVNFLIDATGPPYDTETVIASWYREENGGAERWGDRPGAAAPGSTALVLSPGPILRACVSTDHHPPLLTGAGLGLSPFMRAPPHPQEGHSPRPRPRLQLIDSGRQPWDPSAPLSRAWAREKQTEGAWPGPGSGGSPQLRAGEARPRGRREGEAGPQRQVHQRGPRTTPSSSLPSPAARLSQVLCGAETRLTLPISPYGGWVHPGARGGPRRAPGAPV